MLRFIRRVGLLLVTTCMASCISEEGQCHRRALAMLGCCPSCDADCEVSKHADARFTMESCLADLSQREQDDEPRGETSASEGEAGTTRVDGAGDTTFGATW